MPIRRTKTQRPADANTDTPEEIVASAAIDVTTPEDARYLRAVVALGSDAGGRVARVSCLRRMGRCGFGEGMGGGELAGLFEVAGGLPRGDG